MDLQYLSSRNIGRSHFGVAVIAFATALALGVPVPASAAEPVKIGFSAPKTGFLGVASPVCTQAYELWREKVNERGGLDVGGKERRQIQFISYDDQSIPTKAAEIYEKLITSDKVDLLLAPYATPFHEPVRQPD